MVMKPEPLFRAVEHVIASSDGAGPDRIVLMTPQGEPFTQARARELAQEEHLLLLGSLLQKRNKPGELQSLGTLWKTREKYELAIPLLEKAAASIPNDPVLLFDLAVALHGIRRVPARMTRPTHGIAAT